MERDKQEHLAAVGCRRFYCRTSLKGKRHNVEHVRARSRGGRTVPENLVLSCSGCNRIKGSRPVSKQVLRSSPS
jgi:5-methylcytosine-specific restriction endonuclease McrA